VIRALADGRLVAAPWSLVIRAALLVAVAGGLVPGCFYADQINQRPSITIEGEPAEAVHRGDHLSLSARAEDPDGHYVTYKWRAYACTDAAALDGCDTDPFETELVQTFAFDVPVTRANDAPVASLRIVLEAIDELGATARPSEELLLAVINRPPSLVLDRSSRYAFVQGTPINVFAQIGDLDDGPAAVMPLTWVVFGPAGADTANALVPLSLAQDPQDPDHLQFGKVFTPNTSGTWTLRVTAMDAFDSVSVDLMIAVMPDGPPCLAQLQPIVPTFPVALPITDPTLFRVPVVIDDLDVYPPQPDDTILGVTTFAWSVKAPGQATHLAIPGATSNTFSFDPASYALGDIVELRVEIADRAPEGINCLDSVQSCSVISQPTCIQRQTWRVEVR
jgi:hypothetical protein